MTDVKKTTEKHLMVFSGRAYPELADEVAELLETTIVPSNIFDFANGETYVRFNESVRGCDAFVIQSHTTPINNWIMGDKTGSSPVWASNLSVNCHSIASEWQCASRRELA